MSDTTHDGPVPRPRRVSPAAFEALLRLSRRGGMVALTGAGCSTESGIPDYRGGETGRDDHEPIRYREFVRRPGARALYWSRSAVGWTRVRDARPNDAHRALARLESTGTLRGLVTQNVDGLHRAAGSRRVLNLHGSLGEVCCLECGARESRAAVQRRLLSLNPGFRERRRREGAEGDGTVAPDGDADVVESAARGFAVPGCRRCGGVLKPAVVFFGENVPEGRVGEARELVAGARVLLVAGSSLSVYSGYRLVRLADERAIPVAIVNLGPTRGDAEARVRVSGRVGDVLPRLADALIEGGRAA